MNPRFCPLCAAPLALRSAVEDGGPRERLRCTACEHTHWNNPVPVLAAVLECIDGAGQLLLARNAAWPGRFFGLVTGFMEAGETPEQGLLREVAEETALQPAGPATLLGVWDFQKKNELIVAYHLPVQGTSALWYIRSYSGRLPSRLPPDAVSVRSPTAAPRTVMIAARVSRRRAASGGAKCVLCRSPLPCWRQSCLRVRINS